MAVPAHEEGGGGGGAGASSSDDAAVIEHSILAYMIPFATDFGLEQALEQLRETASSPSAFPLDAIPQRESLFFDETVDVYLVLRTARAAEGSRPLRSWLRRLVVSLEARIVNGSAPGRDAPPASEVIYSAAVDDAAEPLLVLDEPSPPDDADGDAPQYGYAAWKISVFLARPRMRLQSPTVVFTASAHLRSESGPGAGPAAGPGGGYLPSGVPSGLNLLETFGGDPALGGIAPRLSATRVSRVAPVTQAKDPLRPLRCLPARGLALPVHPVMHTRVRFSRPNTSPPSPAIVALLEMDFTPFFDCEVVLDDIRVALPEGGGTAEDLGEAAGGGALALPLRCVAHDHVTFLYRLAPEETDGPAAAALRNQARELAIAIGCTALVSEEGGCTPRLRMAWSTALDFTLPVNPGFGASVPAPLQRAHRPSQLSISETVGTSLVSPSVTRPDALPSLEAAAAAARTTEASLPDFGITMTFSAPEGPVRPGDEFVWTVFVVNRTRDTTPALPPLPASRRSSSAAAAVVVPTVAAPEPPAGPRKLALFAVPKRRRNEVRVLRPPSTAGPQARRKSAMAPPPPPPKDRRFPPGGGGAAGAAADQYPPQDNLLADAVLDENVVHAMQRSSLVDATEVVCLSADVRVGPLAPGACHVAELRFVALRAGLVGVDCVRVVDLASQEHVDVRDLPVMIVEPGEGGA